MAFPASQQRLADALAVISSGALALKNQVQRLRDDSAAGDTNRDRYVGLMRAITDNTTRWQQAAGVGGLAEYAQDQYDNVSLDVAAEYLAMRTAALALRDWIFANIPMSGQTPLTYNLLSDGTQVPLTFTSAQTAGFRTEADAFIGTVG